ncbi:MATE efflux family protein [Catonella morbi ATCC 51271]|uniref:MATE efflux family protein n=1 Tax=Catonella morbi ATCC 51271 TaxID=592026 RepID=V2Y4M4_9FIRM|nr:MATE family efflux transporter [Catonella morbi]ESL03047.1 MATE efflux family protein [Catonella morbi ATCC 51271]
MNKATQNQNSILTGSISKSILMFFFPILLGSFLQQLYSTTDALIVGRYVNKEALAAIGATTYIINILIGFFVGLSAGAAVIISQFYGANRGKDLSDSVHTAIALSLVSGVIIMIVGIVFSPMILKIMNTPADIIEPSTTYLRVYFLGSIPVLIYNMGSSILRAVGDSKSPLYVLIVCTIANVVLDILFVAVFKMGIFGAALATLLAQVISAAVVITMLMRAEFSYKLDLKKISFHQKELTAMLKIGLPTGFQAVMYYLSNMIVQSSVNSFGTDTVAAWTVFTTNDNFYWMVIGAFGVSVTTFVGQNFGAGNFDRIKKSVRITYLFTSLSAILLSLILYIGCEQLLNLFTSETAVIDVGVYMFRHYCQYYIFFVGIEVLSGAIRATGDSFIPTVITAVGICGLRILWIFFIVPANPHIGTVLTVYPVTWFLTSFVFTVYYLHGGWLRKRRKIMGI